MLVLPAHADGSAANFTLLRDSMLQYDGLALTEALDPASIDHWGQKVPATVDPAEWGGRAQRFPSTSGRRPG